MSLSSRGISFSFMSDGIGDIDIPACDLESLIARFSDGVRPGFPLCPEILFAYLRIQSKDAGARCVPVWCLHPSFLDRWHAADRHGRAVLHAESVAQICVFVKVRPFDVNCICEFDAIRAGVDACGGPHARLDDTAVRVRQHNLEGVQNDHDAR